MTLRCSRLRRTSPNRSIGMLPALRGAQRGLMKAALGPPADTGRWCPGGYRGTIRVQRRGRSGVNGPVVERFSFGVRPR
jgi:hypothetical protein